MKQPCVRSLALLMSLLGCAHASPAAVSELQVGVTGEAPPQANHNPAKMLAAPGVQALILDIAVKPRTRAHVERALAGEAVGIDDLLAVGLVRERRGRYWLDFNLLTARDQARILAEAEPAGRELADMVLARRADLDALAAEHGYEGPARAAMYYFVIGCIALDWDGLDFTRERGYRVGAQRVIDGHEFTPWAKQRDGAPALRGLLWGSHNDRRARAVLTSFGDHDALPRFGFPDLAWTDPPELSAFPGGSEAGLDAVGDVMLALRREPLRPPELASQLGLDPDALAPLLDLLARAGYLETRDERLHPLVVVMTGEDRPMVAAMVPIIREILARWHEAHYADMQRSLADLTPVRNGVPFPRVYTEVWHYVFGVANRSLVERGLFADPYAPTREHRGFLPVVFEPALWPDR